FERLARRSRIAPSEGGPSLEQAHLVSVVARRDQMRKMPLGARRITPSERDSSSDEARDGLVRIETERALGGPSRLLRLAVRDEPCRQLRLRRGVVRRLLDACAKGLEFGVA